ncbi:uncharacterized protein LOC116349590 [Contarinia nasturtii]|uniref:uncharacterized protein LOC116349590 n=1 Tax=Contarinia nasturtii TaxID=265458 RepID=UPI0012D3F49E|nr:uncharacterized protein LOC116349590 [Contarinia nasturtii]
MNKLALFNHLSIQALYNIFPSLGCTDPIVHFCMGIGCFILKLNSVSGAVRLQDGQKVESDEVDGSNDVEDDSTDVNEARPLKLTQLNNDCLVHIMKFLNLKQLLDVVDANKELKTAAESVFKKRYREKEFFFRGGIKHRTYFPKNCKIQHIDHPRTSYQLLRSFGHLIPKMEILNPFVLTYVNEYCCDSVKSISFIDMFQIDYDTFEKPFINAEKVEFWDCHLQVYSIWEKLFSSRFNKFFPKISTLTLYKNLTLDLVEVHFAHLDQLNILATIDVMTKIIRLNPQMRRLVVNAEDQKPFRIKKCLSDASKYLKLLEHLEIERLSIGPYDFGKDDVFYFACLKELKIDCVNNATRKIPILSHCLKEFSCKFPGDQLDKFVIAYLKANPFITKLSLECNGTGIEMEENVMEIIEALPLVEEIHFSKFNVSTNDVFRFLENCHSLQKFCCQMACRHLDNIDHKDCHLDLNHLNDKLPIGWEALNEKQSERCFVTIEKWYPCTKREPVYRRLTILGQTD